MTENLLLGEVKHCAGLVINCPEVFRREDFMEWLDEKSNQHFVATWHDPGHYPTEGSDVFVLVDSSYEGSDSNMPEDIWRAICDAVYVEYGNGPCGFDQLLGCISSHVCVRLTNLEE